MSVHPQIPDSIETWSRARLQRTAKSLGLPATGPTQRITRHCRIATTDPRTWSREEFDLLLPHLSVHQDLRGGSVNSILREGLSRGMVDPDTGLEPGSRQWTWAHGYVGVDAFVFVTGGLKFLGLGNPRLAPGNIPIFHAKPAKGGSLWEAIQRGATFMRSTQPQNRLTKADRPPRNWALRAGGDVLQNPFYVLK